MKNELVTEKVTVAEEPELSGPQHTKWITNPIFQLVCPKMGGLKNNYAWNEQFSVLNDYTIHHNSEVLIPSWTIRKYFFKDWGVFEKKSPSKMIESKTKGTIRKCSSRAFQ
jgi:hypothetical protein